MFLTIFTIEELTRINLRPRADGRIIRDFKIQRRADNENLKKAIGLKSKTTTSHVHRTFLFISFPFLHDYDVKMPDFAFYRGRKQATTKFYFSF